MFEQVADKLSWPAIRQLSKFELTGACLAILSFTLLPVGHVVEVSTGIMALGGLFLVSGKQSRLELFNSDACRFFSMLFALLWLPMLISIIDADKFTHSAVFSLKYLRFFFAGLFVAHLLKSVEIRKLVLAAISFTVAAWLLDSLIQWITGTDLLGRSYIGTRLAGPFEHLTLPIILSLFLTLVLIFAKIHWSAYFFWGLFFVSVLILFLAGSRASLIALTLAGLLYSSYVFIKAPKKPVLIFAILTIGIILIGIAGYTFDKGIKGRIDSASKIFAGDYDSINQATSQRLPIWDVALRMGLNNPINGIGVSEFRYQYKAYATPTDPFKSSGANHPHLFLLEQFAGTGVIGVIGLLMITVLLLRQAWSNVRQWAPLQAGSAITIAITFFPLNSHMSLYGSFYSQIAWLATAIACACLFESDTTTEVST